MGKPSNNGVNPTPVAVTAVAGFRVGLAPAAGYAARWAEHEHYRPEDGVRPRHVGLGRACFLALGLTTPVLAGSKGKPVPLACDAPVIVRVPLDASSPQWPRNGWQFSCAVREAGIAVVAVSTPGAEPRWAQLSRPLRTSVPEESSFVLPLASICSAADGTTGSLVGHLKWGGVAVALRNCEKGVHDAVEVEMRVLR